MAEQPSPDELAEAEAWMRAHMSETTYAVGGETDARELWLVMAEFDRLRLVEQAATALVEHWEALDDVHRGWVADAPEMADDLDALATAVHEP